MKKRQSKLVISLGLIMSFRMLGLFMILPVFTLYAQKLHDVTPTLIGVALGIYGLTQACLQIPFGMLSDKIGRKPVIVAGLLIFALGSVVAALSTSIHGIIFGRALQGGGAIGSVIIALLADSTEDENRTKAMAMMGMSIGLAFAMAMVLGPALNTWIGIPGIFWLTSILAVIGILILLITVPTPKKSVFHRDTEPMPALFKKILGNTELLRLDAGIFIQHAILTASFIVIPVTMEHYANIKEAHQWFVYLPVLIIAYILMIPFIIIAEKKRRMKTIFVGCIFFIAFSQFCLIWLHNSIISFIVALLLFFTAFTILEASLPSLVSKISPAGSKGTAMGIYSTSQFLGIFIGGTLGGWIYNHVGMTGVFTLCSVGAIFWLLIAITMQKPPHLATRVFNLQHLTTVDMQILKNKLANVPGIHESLIDQNDAALYLKIDSQIFNDSSIKTLLVSLNQEQC